MPKKEVHADPMLNIEENYDSDNSFKNAAVDGELNLYKNLKWTIWEFIDYDGAKKKWAEENYEKLCRKVAWFDNIISFH